jgi:2-iminobutanoate/2-iminopropanoate deaminase
MSELDPQIISVPGLPATNPTYSQAVRIGTLVFVSGQLGVDPKTGHIVHGGAVAEYRQALANLARILEAAGTSVRRIVKTTVYMTDIGQLAALNDVYGEIVGSFPPAKTGVEVSALALGGKIEIEAIAAV